MEQMIQVVNRNLQLVFSGEPEGMTEHERVNVNPIN
jgi:hypothetical protein